MKALFIQADETVIFVEAGCDENVAHNGPIATAKDVAKKLEGFEGVQKVVRINYNDRTVEDISEEVTATYDDGLMGSDRMFDAAVDHPFVANSEAFESVASDMDREIAIERHHGSYAKQHRLTASDVLTSGRAA